MVKHQLSSKNFHSFDAALTASHNVPTVLLPISLRSGIRYRSLAQYNFLPHDKLWVCETLVNLCTNFETELLQVIQAFSKRYYMKNKTVIEWMNIYSENGDFSHPFGPIDAIGLSAITDMVNENIDHVDEGKLYKLIKNELGDTLIRRN